MKRTAALSILYLAGAAATMAWTLTAEDPATTYTESDGTITISAPGGATLWHDEMMQGNTVIEYEARIVADPRYTDESGRVRTSDLNCFWMADDREPEGGSGTFANNYALSLYYMGYGGNWNTTTRFRRYNGDSRGVKDAQYRPAILKEYTDAAHLLEGDRWYRIRLEQIDGRVRYYIDGECLVDYVDPKPLQKGYFGFRTTKATAQLRDFAYSCTDPTEGPVALQWIGAPSRGVVSFGVPFLPGEVQGQGFTLSGDGTALPLSHRTLAQWPDGSAKWVGFTTVVDRDYGSITLSKGQAPAAGAPGAAYAELPPFEVVLNGRVCPVEEVRTEREDAVSRVRHYKGPGYELRAYISAYSPEIKIVHTLLVDSTLNADGLSDLRIRFKVPMHGEDHQRYVAFGSESDAQTRHVTTMSVKPLIARRPIDLERNDPKTQEIVRQIAAWDGFRLSQLGPNGYSVRKRATERSPWIGTIEGHRHDGTVAVGDSTGRTTFRLKDFWQSYPSTLQVDGARGDTATVTIALYSAEAEPYRFDHYDEVAHGLDAAYEDVQPGMSTACGIARTSVIYINEASATHSPLLPTPAYLHSRRAFGVWSLPAMESARDTLVEETLQGIMAFYKREIERHGWYGYFNYGDVMHGYDASRDEWRYDVGGYAWDNTELGTPAMLWYQFVRTGDPDVWIMAEAMTRHCSEVDCYHSGAHAGLGSRHNVLHWGCGAKEARISEAWWNRFYYYLSGGDERTGDLMTEVVDTDQLLYTLDPMRLAQPRDLYPCTAPARLRIGPDWMAYASNWYTEWERTADPRYLQKILTGMNSIAQLRHGFFDGPKALGYDPATGVISNECDSEIMNTNHLMPIMGGFELLNEMELSIDHEGFYQAWLEHNRVYKETALRVSRNRFLIPRLAAYAGWRTGDEGLKAQAWRDLLEHMPLGDRPTLWTNDCATWALDAIFMKETIN